MDKFAGYLFKLLYFNSLTKLCYKTIMQIHIFRKELISFVVCKNQIICNTIKRVVLKTIRWRAKYVKNSFLGKES